MEQACPECGSTMMYDISTKHFVCKKCGLYVTREQLQELRWKLRSRSVDEKKKKKKLEDEYLSWWLSKK